MANQIKLSTQEHQCNLDSAYREISQREAQGNAVVNKRTCPSLTPDLLSALKALMADFGGTVAYPSSSPQATQARAVIAKAEGTLA